MMRAFAILLLAAGLGLVAGCTGVRLAEAPPAMDRQPAEIPGFPGVRSWGDEAGPGFEDGVRALMAQIAGRIRAEGPLPNGGQLDTLVLSGGGSDGPFGAGLLVGWTEAGTRPEFNFVTGISAGALIAPFAFLGPDKDGALRDFSVENSTETLVTVQILRGLFQGLGIFDTSPLELRLRGLITPEVVGRIAEEHARGRRLLIGTTNLDAQRPVVWDIGAIAATGRAEARDLIVKVMIASASIPGAFPPVFFTVETPDGRRWSEMHVDGGVTKQLFFYSQDARLPPLPPALRGRVRPGTIYIVRNTKLLPDYAPVEPGLVEITARSVSTLIKFGGRADVRLIEAAARRDGFAVKITAVPESFQMEENELFDPAYMRALFEVGREMAAQPGTWLVDIPRAGEDGEAGVVAAAALTTPAGAAAAGRPGP